MEHHTEIEQLLFNGLPEQERQHVARVINHVNSEKLRRKRAEDVRDNSVIDVIKPGDDSELL